MMFRLLCACILTCMVFADRVEVLRELLDVLLVNERRQFLDGENTKDELREMYAYVRDADDNEELKWCTAEYNGKLITEGSCGTDYQEFLELLQSDIRLYGYVGIQMDMHSNSKKFAFITYIGPAVSPLKKAKVSTDKAFVKAIFINFDKEILADEPQELAQGEIVAALQELK